MNEEALFDELRRKDDHIRLLEYRLRAAHSTLEAIARRCDDLEAEVTRLKLSSDEKKPDEIVLPRVTHDPSELPDAGDANGLLYIPEEIRWPLPRFVTAWWGRTSVFWANSEAINHDLAKTFVEAMNSAPADTKQQKDHPHAISATASESREALREDDSGEGGSDPSPGQSRDASPVDP